MAAERAQRSMTVRGLSSTQSRNDSSRSELLAEGAYAVLAASEPHHPRPRADHSMVDVGGRTPTDCQTDPLRSCSLVNVFAPLMLLIAPAVASARVVETPLMARNGALLVELREVDWPRGFDRVRWVLRRAQPDGVFRPIETVTALETDRLWYVERGEVELYRVDLGRARRALLLKYEASGFTTPASLPVEPQSACDLGECAPALLAGGSFRLGDERIDVHLETGEGGGLVRLEAVSTRRSFTFDAPEAIDAELNHGKRVRLDLARLSSVSLMANGAWLIIALDTVVPIHVEVPPGRVLIPVQLDMLISGLGVDVDDAFFDGVLP